MTDKRDEDLSALFDDELPGLAFDSAVEELVGNEGQIARWGRYQTIGDAIRGQLPPYVRADLVTALRRELQREPPIFAPRNHVAGTRRLLRPAIGVGLAASVATVALLNFPAPESTLNPAKGYRTVGSRVAAERAGPEIPDQLYRYLVTHNVYAPSNSIKGMLSYAPVVVYEHGR